ncbi:uncharacterized protein LOC109935062 isoform X2 [Rhincodon typus]|uniref:uncharacterized protein LOC109935062 isoform X2 n=1 Tax=Rhincodon typus TaxID=259920 RepID=UPI0020301F3A|nr:uncharacterized protein LOC109935062 isoform X2 [Rhincodon typus]
MFLDNNACNARVRNPETMPQSPKKIQVLNVPGNVPVQRLLHKLTIYFQKSSNGGGEVLDVEYPTSVKDCAYVIFEKEEDANNVLKGEHIFQLDNKKYKLEVREVEEVLNDDDNEQVMLFVTTKLDTSCFPEGKARQLICRHNFQVIHSQGFIVEIEGSFPSLVKLRRDLMGFIIHQPTHAVSNQSYSANKKRCERNEESLQSGAFRMHRLPSAPDSGSDSSASSEEDNSASQHASNIHSRSSEPEFHADKSNSSPLPLVASSSSLQVVNSNNKEDTVSYINGGVRDPQAAVKYMSTSAVEKGSISKMDNSSLNAFSSHASNSSSTPPCISFMVDKWAFKYLQTIDGNCLRQLLTKYSTGINIVYVDELCEIFLSPNKTEDNSHRNLFEAKSAICAQIQKIQQELRIHHVDLTAEYLDKKEEILRKCKCVDSISLGVLLEIHGQTVSVVGPSVKSYNIQQYILGKGFLP